ncbi:hypothetical protein DFH27DRAFT_550903 [Peziza echinospora]|nr:hypothetical protein DFH27DRAFT_550903 [Peziza echinospora]
MDDNIAQFIAFTNASVIDAEGYLQVSDGNLNQAIQLFFDTGGAAMGGAPQAHSPPPQPRAQTTTHQGSSHHDAIAVGESDNDDDYEEDDELRAAIQASHPGGSSQRTTRSRAAAAPHNPAVEDDEAMARRLQEELYGSAGGFEETNGVRAPIGKTTETLVDPDEEYLEQMSSRMRVPRPAGRVGIFNQRLPSGAVWGESGSSSRRRLAEATGGASDQSAKSQSLAEMYRPPFEIIRHETFEEAREIAKDEKKWILVNIQDDSIFDCQVLNRDIWKANEVKDTIKENFIFLQYNRAGIDGQTYVRLYFPHAIDVPPTSSLNPFPIIAIVDPRTGEQVKVWAETPKKSLEFVMQLHEFLERYSLHDNARNPIQRNAKAKVDVDHMTEAEMLEVAMRRSLKGDADAESANHDPDELTRGSGPLQSKSSGKQKQREDEDLMDFDEDQEAMDEEPQHAEPEALTPFQTISQTNHHTQPKPGTPRTTRIQFKFADGARVVHGFGLDESVTRIYEYVKADLLPEMAQKKGEEVTPATSAKPFELVSVGKNLIDFLDLTVEKAGLQMAAVMVEFVESD